MTVDNILNALTDMPQQYIQEAECDALPKSNRALYIGIAAVACLCVLTTAVIGYRKAAPKEPMLITSQNSIGDFVSSSYARGPFPGEVWFSYHLSSDIDKRGEAADNAVYWVEIIFSNKDIIGSANMYKDLTAAECKRLAALGYELYIHEYDWTGYWGESKHFSTVCGVLSVEQMEALEELSEYGCYLDFASKTREECVRVEP